MKTIRKRTALLILAALTAAGILYFARELNWAPARQNPPPAQTEAPKPPEPDTPEAPPEATPPETPEPPGQPESGALEKQPVMVSEHFAAGKPYRGPAPGRGRACYHHLRRPL